MPPTEWSLQDTTTSAATTVSVPGSSLPLQVRRLKVVLLVLAKVVLQRPLPMVHACLADTYITMLSLSPFGGAVQVALLLSVSL